MFDDVYDAFSRLWSWRWPVIEGTVTAASIERTTDRNGNERAKLAVAYKFSVGDDGPYTGEVFWEPLFRFSPVKELMEARRRIRVGHKIEVRYRPDDPSINTAQIPAYSPEELR